MAKGSVMELRAALSLLETTRDATHSELHDARQLIIGPSSLFLLSLASRAGLLALTHHELDSFLLNGAGQRAELADECGKVLVLEETRKTRVERDLLWHKLQAEVEVPEGVEPRWLSVARSSPQHGWSCRSLPLARRRHAMP